MNGNSDVPGELEHRLRYERMISEISQLLLTETSYAAALNGACRLLGEATGVSRVYIFENSVNNTACSNTVEWVAKGIAPARENLQNIPYDSTRYWKITLERGELIRADDIHTLPDDVVEILEWQGIRSILVVPLDLFERWYGFLGFDVCDKLRQWTDPDIQVLLTAARLISTVLEKRFLEQKLAHTSRLSAVGSLAAGVAHEYNNLHAGIMGLIELALEDRALGEQTRNDLQRVLKLIGRGVQLTGRLLNLSRRNATVEPVNVRSVVEDSLAILTRQLATEEVDVEFKYQASNCWVSGNVSEISQVVLNLLINAAEALRTSRVKELLLTLTNSAPGQLALTVADTGPGVPPELLPLIFEPFFTTKGKLGGGLGDSAGLGLAISSRIASQHGGTLSATNFQKGGAIFRLELPTTAAPPEVAAARETTSEIAPVLQGRIGVLDDEQPLLDVLRRALAAEGHHVEVFSTDKSAVAALTDRTFDLFLVDLVMPGDAGLSMLRHLAGLEGAQRPTVIVMSGRPRKDVDAVVGDLPYEHYLPKPFPVIPRVAGFVQRLLRKRASGTDGSAPTD